MLAGRSGLIEMGSEEQLGELDDGFGEHLSTLEDFPYAKYGIDVPL